jgi:hypothetical protein
LRFILDISFVGDIMARTPQSICRMARSGRDGLSESPIGLFLHEILRGRPQIVDELTMDVVAFGTALHPEED